MLTFNIAPDKFYDIGEGHFHTFIVVRRSQFALCMASVKILLPVSKKAIIHLDAHSRPYPVAQATESIKLFPNFFLVCELTYMLSLEVLM